MLSTHDTTHGWLSWQVLLANGSLKTNLENNARFYRIIPQFLAKSTLFLVPIPVIPRRNDFQYGVAKFAAGIITSFGHPFFLGNWGFINPCLDRPNNPLVKHGLLQNNPFSAIIFPANLHLLPSGKHTKNYGKSTFFYGKINYFYGHFQ